MKKEKIVFIADQVKSHLNSTPFSKDLECPTEAYCNNVKNTLKSLGFDVVHYYSPEELIDNIEKHKSDIVISIFSGEDSKNRKALIPSICESYNICYAGADTFTQIICADKYLAKRYSQNFGVFGAKDVLITSLQDVDNLKYLNFPIIIKPNNEGGSNGISEKNIVNSYEEAKNFVSNYFKRFNPLIAEELIKGSEFTISIIGNGNACQILGETRLNIENNLKIFDYKAKKTKQNKVFKSHVNYLTNEEKEKILNLYRSFGKVDYMRIDGIYNKSGFHLLELTPDTNLDKNSSFAFGALYSNISYDKLIDLIINIAIKSHQLKNANMIENN